MRIIKLEVERYGERGIKVFKYAVSLDPKRHQKIASFIAYVQKICKLEPSQHDLEIDGFQISKHDRTKALKENVVYKLRISHSSKKDYQIRSSQVEDSDDEAAPITKIKGNYEKSKVQQKIAKIARKNKKESSSESDSSSSSSDQEVSSSSSSSSESSQQILPKRLQQKPKVKKVVPSKNESITPKQPIKPSKSQTPKKNKNIDLPKKVANRKAVSPQGSSSSSSSSESEEQLPTLIPAKRPVPAATKSTIKPNLPIKPQKVLPQKKQPSNLFINPHKKAIINDDDDSSSESEPSQYHPKKKPQIIEQPRQKTEISKPQSIQNAVLTNEKPKNDIKIPPALRNKAVAKKIFDQHKENQWICIDKQKLKKWQELGNKNICQAKNKIRFKIVELDEQKFIPVKSGWIIGQVKEVRDNRTVCLVKVEQEGKPYRQTYEIPEHNMDELQINRLLATKQQIQCFEQKKEQELPKQAEKPVQQQNKQSQKFDPQNDKNSVEKFVCGQANYYFSDKNYNTDLFMQMHANRHPQKYINLSFILNFPKVKKVLQNVQKLYEYLKQDEKYEQRNYEIDFERRLIRKKSLANKTEQVQHELETSKNKQKALNEGEQLQGSQIKHQ